MKKISVTILLAATLAGCAHRPVTVNPMPAKRHHAVHKVTAVPGAPGAHPAAAPVPPGAQVAPAPVVPAPVAVPAPQKHGALRWFLRDRSTSGGK